MVSSETTAGEVDQAWVKMTEAARDYARSIGDLTTANALQKQLDAHQNTGKQIENVWTKTIQQVSTAWTDLSKKLVEGDFGSILEGLKGIGETIGRTFIEQGLDYLNQFVEKGLKWVLSNIADIVGAIPGIGGALSNVLTGMGGGAAGAAGTAAGGAGAAGDAASSAGGGGGLLGSAISSGLAATVTAIASVASAVTGVIGVFQSARQEGTLNAIEANTRLTKIFLGGDGGFAASIGQNIEDVRWSTLDTARSVNAESWLHDAWVQLLSVSEDMRDRLMEIRDSVSSQIQETVSAVALPLLPGAEPSSF